MRHEFSQQSLDAGTGSSCDLFPHRVPGCVSVAAHGTRFLLFYHALVVGSSNGHFSHERVNLPRASSDETLPMSTIPLSSGRSCCLFCCMV